MSDDAPNRLVTSAEDAALRTLLEAGRRELPSEAQLAALVAKVDPLGGGGRGGGGRGGAPGSGSGAGWGVVTKAVIALVVGAAAVVTTVALVHRAPVPASIEAPPPIPAVATTAPVTATPVDTTSPLPSASGTASTPSAGTHRTPAVASSTTSASDEVALVERAQDALRSEPARALADCDEHARRYPKGLLVQEREVIGIDALTKLGRRDEAEARARRFAAAFPTSSHLRRIATILGQTP